MYYRPYYRGYYTPYGYGYTNGPSAAPTKTTTKVSAVVESPIYRGWGTVKPYDIVLNVDLKTLVNGGNFRELKMGGPSK